MKNRFLIHELNHTILVVDISKVGLPAGIYPDEGKHQDLPSLRFRSWATAEAYLHKNGLDPKLLRKLAAN